MQPVAESITRLVRPAMPERRSFCRRIAVRLIASFCGLSAMAGPPVVEDKPSDEFVPMFNGADFSGWVLVNTPAETWKYDGDLLVCSGKPIGEIRTQKMYQNFVLELEWRHMVPKGNAGVFVWADDITAPGQPFHRGIEVQVLENSYGNTQRYTTHGDIFPIHGATMTPVNGHGGSRAFPTEQRSRPSPNWNHYRIECRDGDISLAVNGKVVTKGRKCSPRKGYICLESEGGVVHYRNVRIRELSDTPIADTEVARRNRGFRSIYSGLNLSGWEASDAAQASWQPNDWVLAFDGKTAGENAIISSEEKFSGGCLCDVKLKTKGANVAIDLVDQDGSHVASVDLSQPGFADALHKAERWNRIELQLDGQKVKIAINGQSVSGEQISPVERVSLRIRPTGQVDLANIYVRDR